MVELLVVITIIGLLFAIILPTLAKARESSLRIQCASNLRQCGLVESMYSNENKGWLFMRESGNAGTAGSLMEAGANFFAIDFTKYSQPSIWFCPEYRGVGVSTNEPFNLSQQKALFSLNRVGYGFLGAYWTSSGVGAAEPAFGSISRYTNGGATKTAHLRPYMVRMTEWYSDNATDWGATGGSKWHTNFSRGPEGGNILLADGSVVWSRNIFTFFGGEHFTIPEGYPQVP